MEPQNMKPSKHLATPWIILAFIILGSYWFIIDKVFFDQPANPVVYQQGKMQRLDDHETPDMAPTKPNEIRPVDGQEPM